MLVVPRSAHEVGTFGAHTGNGARRDPVSIGVEIPREPRQSRERLRIEHLAAIGPVVVVPGEPRHHPVVHPDVQVRCHEHRRLEPLGDIKGLHRHLETLVRIGGIEYRVPSVAVRGVGQHQQVALLGAGGHAGGRAAALDVEEDRRDLGIVRQADEFLHQRNAGPRGIGERPRPGPPGADHDPCRGELVFRLHDGIAVLARDGIGPQLPAEGGERLHQRSGRRDRVPRAHGGARIHGAERGGGVAVHQHVALGLVEPLQVKRQRAIEVLAGVVVAHPDRLVVGIEQPLLLAELLVQHCRHHVHIDVEQRGEGAGVHDVAHQGAVAVALERLDAHLAERHAENRDPRPHQVGIERPGGVVEQIAAGPHRGHVARVGRGVERHHQIQLRWPRGPAIAAHPDLVPGGQSLDVAREDVLAGDGDSHPEDRLHQQPVGAGGAGAVDGADLERKVVDAAHRATASCPA